MPQQTQNIMVRATKNGHTHGFSDVAWERMGTGTTRMGWTLESADVVPAEVEVLRQKKAEEKVEEVPVVELKKKTAASDTVVDEPVAEEKPATEKKGTTKKKKTAA